MVKIKKLKQSRRTKFWFWRRKLHYQRYLRADEKYTRSMLKDTKKGRHAKEKRTK